MIKELTRSILHNSRIFKLIQKDVLNQDEASATLKIILLTEVISFDKFKDLQTLNKSNALILAQTLLMAFGEQSMRKILGPRCL
mmetsp:Transcript_17905/g.17115  ORF Transcript_17905/g.17115 Transcript_17905/m.17115 type:complete len:84 (+) Transcript_17905:109-360(+)